EAPAPSGFHRGPASRMQGDRPGWGDTVIRTSVGSHPCLMYQHRPRSIAALLRESRRWSDRTFIVHGIHRLTFGEHESAVRSVARSLASRGVAPGHRVGLMAANCPEWPVAFFATMELGAIAVPLNSWWSESEVEHACHLVEPGIV